MLADGDVCLFPCLLPSQIGSEPNRWDSPLSVLLFFFLKFSWFPSVFVSSSDPSDKSLLQVTSYSLFSTASLNANSPLSAIPSEKLAVRTG